MVELPTYFELINTNFSYQLTAIGTPQQPYVLTEISGNTFEIAGEPNTKVSWTVYADRNDAEKFKKEILDKKSIDSKQIQNLHPHQYSRIARKI